MELVPNTPLTIMSEEEKMKLRRQRFNASANISTVEAIKVQNV